MPKKRELAKTLDKAHEVAERRALMDVEHLDDEKLQKEIRRIKTALEYANRDDLSVAVSIEIQETRLAVFQKTLSNRKSG